MGKLLAQCMNSTLGELPNNQRCLAHVSSLDPCLQVTTFSNSRFTQVTTGKQQRAFVMASCLFVCNKLFCCSIVSYCSYGKVLTLSNMCVRLLCVGSVSRGWLQLADRRAMNL